MSRTASFASMLALGAALSVSAHAAPYTVDAKLNSSTTGTALDTVTLALGDSFSVTAALTDLWSAGGGLRVSNAAGLTGPVYAVAGDDSGVAPGTQIGEAFPNWTQGNLSAPYGSLVGQIGVGDYFLVGTAYTGVAASAGVLKLYYWDENASDNFGSVVANVSVTAVPEPESYAMMLAGLGALGWLARRRRT